MNGLCTQALAIALAAAASCLSNAHAWVSPSLLSPLTASRKTGGSHRLPVFALSASSALKDPSMDESNANGKDEDGDDEFEYIEYDILTEAEFLGSEWLVGTVPIGDTDNVQETWVRLAVDNNGKNVAVWGDKSVGTWTFDVASQFVSFSKENLFGKQIWACVVDDFYYLQGTVRGWSFFTPASVTGQWQGKRLGVDPDEAGVAPWFQTSIESTEESGEETAQQTQQSEQQQDQQQQQQQQE